MTIAYPCKKCGCCCRSIGRSKLYLDLDDGTGICLYFDKRTNLCTIYEKRPEKCNINAMYHYFQDSMSYEEYIKLNIQSCQMLRRNQ